MAKDNDKMSVAAAAKVVGKHPPQMYKMIENEGMPVHIVDGKKMVVISEVNEFLKNRAASPKARGHKATTEGQITERLEPYIKPFEKLPVLALWHRGNDKGWAVAAIDEILGVEYDLDEVSGQRKERLVSFKVDYKDPDTEITFTASKIIEQVGEGKMVFAEPQEVIRLLIAQLERHRPTDKSKDKYLEDALASLYDAVGTMLLWKADRTKRLASSEQDPV